MRKIGPPRHQAKKRLVEYYPGCSGSFFADEKYFETERIRVTKGFSFSVMENSFQVLMCLDGYGQVEVDGDKPVRFAKGETVFLPAGIGRCLIIGDASVLKIRC